MNTREHSAATKFAFDGVPASQPCSQLLCHDVEAKTYSYEVVQCVTASLELQHSSRREAPASPAGIRDSCVTGVGVAAISRYSIGTETIAGVTSEETAEIDADAIVAEHDDRTRSSETLIEMICVFDA